jgi:hypothetical protein
MSTAFAGLTIAAVLIARPSTHHKSKAAPIPPPAVVSAPVPSPKPAGRSEITLRAHAPLTVSVTSVTDGRILLPETMLHAGQTTIVPRLGPAFLKYSAGENLEIEVDGHRYAMPATGASRAKIN